MKKEIRKIGIITGGGDCSGLNAVINGITKAAINKYGVEVVGFTRGYAGLYKNDFRPLGLKAVSGILHEGGTILKSSNKDNLFNFRVRNENGTYRYDLNMSYASSGVYIVRLGDNVAFATKRIIVK